MNKPKTHCNAPEKDYSGRLFDTLISRLSLRSDAGLARLLEKSPSVISNIRHGNLKIGSNLILTIHEKSGMPVKEIRSLQAA